MNEELQDNGLKDSTESSTDDSRVKIEFVEIYDESENDLALAMNCSNG